MKTGRGWGEALKQMDELMVSGTATGLTDGQLLERVANRRRSGADLAFETLVSRHGRMVRDVCRQVLRNDHDADDAFQAVFLVLARRAGSIRDPDRLASWLHGVALRTARVARRRRVVAIVHDLRNESDEGESADRRSIRLEEAEVLHDEIGRLPEAQRLAVLLCHFQGLTHQEAAGRLGVPSATIGVRLMRARERLRARLARRGFAPSVALFAAKGTAILDPSRVHGLLSFTIGRGITSGEVPAGVASLAEGVLRTMVPIQLKIAIALLGFGLVAGTAWTFAKGPAPVANPVQAQAPRPTKPILVEDPELAEFRKVYRLDPGQVVKRIEPPFALWRTAEIESRQPNMIKEHRDRGVHLTTLIYGQKKGVLGYPSLTFAGSTNDEGRWLVYLLEQVAGFPAQDVEGPDDLLKTPIKADWIVDAEAPRERVIAAFDAILREDCKLPIRLKVVEKEEDVVIARGRYQLRPIVEGEDTVEIYGAALTPK